MTIHDLEQFNPNWFYNVADQLQRHIYGRAERAFAAGDAARDAIMTREALAARQRTVRELFLASLGGLPSPLYTPPEAEIAGVVRADGFRVEKVLFQSRPGHHVTANLYLPDDLDGRRGAVMFLCGHHMQAKHQPEYQTVCQYLVRAGLIVLAQDPIGQGERFSYYEPALNGETVPWGCPDHDHAGAQCLPLGDTLARYFLHDAMRGVDYLAGRPEVDAGRIGVTGNSGGGTQSSLLMLGDSRLAAAAPGTFIMNRRTYMYAGGAQDAEQIWPGFTAQGCDHEDILLMLAPRPVRVLAVTGDFFPIEGTRETVARCKRLWEVAGNPGGVDLAEDASNHMFTPRLARAAAEFFARHLLGKEVVLDDAKIEPFEPKRLWCTPSGQVRGEIKETRFVFEETAERLKALEAKRKERPSEERRDSALRWLRARVCRDRRPCDLNPRYIHADRMGTLAVEMALWRSQEDLFNLGALFRDYRQAGQKLPVTLAVWDNGTRCLAPHQTWIRQTCESGRAVLVLDVSGGGALAPLPVTPGRMDEFYGTLHKLATDLIWLDDDLAALRTWDALRALDMIALWPGLDAEDIRVYADGRHGLYGRLAALLDSRICSVEIAGGMKSYAEWVGARHYDSRDIYSVILRGVLSHLDLPEMENRS